MKCGLICARSARTSASISRVRERSSSASSSWPLTHDATSSAARTSPPVVCGAPTTSAPTRVSSTTSGLTMACRTWQPPSSQTRVRSSTIIVRPVSATCADRAGELRAVVAAEAVPGQQPAGVAEPGGRRAEQRAQVAYGPLRARRGQALTQGRAGEGGVVQRAEGGAVGLAAQRRTPPPPSRHAATLTAEPGCSVRRSSARPGRVSARSAARARRQRSRPLPPSAVSRPGPPRSVSLSARPRAVSVALPPRTSSRPSPPSRRRCPCRPGCGRRRRGRRPCRGRRSPRAGRRRRRSAASHWPAPPHRRALAGAAELVGLEEVVVGPVERVVAVAAAQRGVAAGPSEARCPACRRSCRRRAPSARRPRRPRPGASVPPTASTSALVRSMARLAGLRRRDELVLAGAQVDAAAGGDRGSVERPGRRRRRSVDVGASACPPAGGRRGCRRRRCRGR